MSWTCTSCQEIHEEAFDSCWKCGTERNGNKPESPVFEAEELPAEFVERGNPLPCTTTPGFPGREIQEVLGIVCGETILGTGFFSEMAAGFSDFVGGRSGALEEKMRDSRESAMAEMIDQAKVLNGQAIVGVRIGYEVIGNSMMMVSVTGTAVRFADP